MDHLHPLIIDRRPTGYGTEPANLVPCCKDCNQTKGNMEWKKFMRSSGCIQVDNSIANNPTEARERCINIIKEFQKAMPPNKAVIDEETLRIRDRMLCNFDKALKDAQEELLKLKEKIY